MHGIFVKLDSWATRLLVLTLPLFGDASLARGADTPTPRLVAKLPLSFGSSVAVFSPDGKSLATILGTGDKAKEQICVVLWEVATRQIRVTLNPREAERGPILFLPDGKTLATARYYETTVKLWELSVGKVRAELRGHTSGVRALAVMPDGKTLASGESKGIVRLWELATGKELATFTAGEKGFSVSSLAFSLDGKTLAAAGGYGEVRLWDVPGLRLRATLRHDDLHVDQVVFSADGKTLATGATETNLKEKVALQPYVKLWDPATGTMRAKWKIPMIGIDSIAFSPDGRVLAVGGHQPDPPHFFGTTRGETRFFEVATGKEIATIKAKPERLGGSHVAFSPDSRLLAIAGIVVPVAERNTYLVELWDVSDLTAKQAADLVPPAPIPDSKHRQPRQQGDLAPEELKAAWSDLAGSDAPRAYRAIWTLVRAPQQAVPLLERQLRPAPPADLRRIERLVADLGSEEFAVRRQASQELEKVGEQAEPALRKVLQDKPRLELRERAEQLLAKLGGPVTDPEQLRMLRSIEVLEHIGNPEAEKVLRALAKGAPQARATQEALQSLERLGKRLAPTP